MRADRTVQTYSRAARGLHWAVFALLLFQFTIGLTRFDALGEFEDVHGTAGVILLALVIMRLGLRVTETRPEMPSSINPVEVSLERGMEFALYAMLLAKSISGLLLIGASGEDFSFAGQISVPALWPESENAESLFSTAHFLSGVVLFAAAVIHIRFVLRNRLLPRMLSGERS
jgi:cytochrome b561